MSAYVIPKQDYPFEGKPGVMPPAFRRFNVHGLGASPSSTLSAAAAAMKAREDQKKKDLIFGIVTGLGAGTMFHFRNQYPWNKNITYASIGLLSAASAYWFYDWMKK